MKENYSETAVNTNGIIWAYGAKNKYVHAFPGVNGLEAGVPLCGISIRPTIVLDTFDTDDEQYHALLCPFCLKRLPFARLAGPLPEVIANRKAAEQRKENGRVHAAEDANAEYRKHFPSPQEISRLYA